MLSGTRYFAFGNKGQVKNSEKSEILEISEILFPVFLSPSFRFCSTAKIENSDLKISEKNFRGFREFRGFRVFNLAGNQGIFILATRLVRNKLFVDYSYLYDRYEKKGIKFVIPHPLLLGHI